MNGLRKTLLISLLITGLPLLERSSIARVGNGGQSPAGNGDASSVAAQFDCLPEGYRPTDVVSYREKRKGSNAYVTIEERLIELKARCKDGILVDGKGREIRFFRVACYGNPPADYEELRQKELEELEKLRKRYCVIVMECDPRIS